MCTLFNVQYLKITFPSLLLLRTSIHLRIWYGEDLDPKKPATCFRQKRKEIRICQRSKTMLRLVILLAGFKQENTTHMRYILSAILRGNDDNNVIFSNKADPDILTEHFGSTSC